MHGDLVPSLYLCLEHLLVRRGSLEQKAASEIVGIYVYCFGATGEGSSASWPACISVWSWGPKNGERSWYGLYHPGLGFWVGCRCVSWKADCAKPGENGALGGLRAFGAGLMGGQVSLGDPERKVLYFKARAALFCLGQL